MKCIELTFAAANGETVLQNLEQTACHIVFDGKKLSFELFYDFSSEPLRLTADAERGDAVRLTVSPVRIGLYVNNALLDEEWSCGNGYLSTACVQSGTFAVHISMGELKQFELPEQLRSGIKACELRKPGVNIGDCMPYSDENGDGRYHLFYLLDRHHHRSKWHLGAHQWAHVSTEDFLHWDEHPMALPVTEPWEGSICTGSIIKSGNLWYAWYAVRMFDHSPARLSCAVSKDIMQFEKTGEYFTMPERYEPIGARDPKPFFACGQYHMLVTTRLKDG